MSIEAIITLIPLGILIVWLAIKLASFIFRMAGIILEAIVDLLTGD